MQSILFSNELSLAVKNESSTITLIEKDQRKEHDEPGQTKNWNSKAELHQKKITPSIWWDYKGVVYFESLPNNRTINSDVHCLQLVKLEEAIKEKRPELANSKGIVFHRDNARPHTSSDTYETIGA